MVQYVCEISYVGLRGPGDWGGPEGRRCLEDPGCSYAKKVFSYLKKNVFSSPSMEPKTSAVGMDVGIGGNRHGHEHEFTLILIESGVTPITLPIEKIITMENAQA